MKIKIILQFDVCWIVCFLVSQMWNKTLADPFREECAKMGIFKKKHQDSSLQNHIIEIIDVSHVTFCTTACLDHAQCRSYNFQEAENVVKLCELSSATATASSTDLISRQGYSYYDAEDDPVCESACPSGHPCGYSCSGIACQYYPASCKMVKELGLSYGDREYDLYLLHPDCSQKARVYCADMNISSPLEYITLFAGRDTNYALDNRLPWGDYQSSHGKTAYDKIRLEVPSLKVLIDDSRFSVQIEGTSVRYYATAADCMWAANCEDYARNKYGKTETNLTGTDFKFPSSIPYEMIACVDRKTWSVRCGGHCGGCTPTTLVLEIDGC